MQIYALGVEDAENDLRYGRATSAMQKRGVERGAIETHAATVKSSRNVLHVCQKHQQHSTQAHTKREREALTLSLSLSLATDDTTTCTMDSSFSLSLFFFILSLGDRRRLLILVPYRTVALPRVHPLR